VFENEEVQLQVGQEIELANDQNWRNLVVG
jgi:hypothetical protein